MRHYLYVDFAEMPLEKGRSAGAKSKSRDTIVSERLKIETCCYICSKKRKGHGIIFRYYRETVVRTLKLAAVGQGREDQSR